MKSIHRIFKEILKACMDTYISFECFIIRFFSIGVLQNELLEALSDSENSIEASTISVPRKKILILRKDVIGDFILFIPTLQHYRDYFKDAELCLVVNTVALELGTQFDFVDTVIPYDSKQFRTNFWYRRRFFHTLAKQNFDIVIHAVYSREYIGDRMVRATGAPITFAFKAESGPMRTDKSYTTLIDTPKELNEPDRNMYFLSKIVGTQITATFPSLDYTKFDSTRATELLRTLKLQENDTTTPSVYAVVLPGAGATYRTWQLEKFAEVTEYIAHTKNIPVLLCGSLHDKPLTAKIYSLCKNKERVFDVAGILDIPNFGSLLHNALFYFGSETGPLHLATAVGTPVIAVLGGGHRGRFFPYGNPQTNRFIADDHIACIGDGWKCSENLTEGEIAPCIRDISVAQATAEIDTLLAIIQK